MYLHICLHSLYALLTLTFIPLFVCAGLALASWPPLRKKRHFLGHVTLLTHGDRPFTWPDLTHVNETNVDDEMNNEMFISAIQLNVGMFEHWVRRPGDEITFLKLIPGILLNLTQCSCHLEKS